MTTAILSYLDYDIIIELPDLHTDPDFDDTIHIAIYRQQGTYDPNKFEAYVHDYTLRGKSINPNYWIKEAINSALGFLKEIEGVVYCESRLIEVVTTEPDEWDDIPF